MQGRKGRRFLLLIRFRSAASSLRRTSAEWKQQLVDDLFPSIYSCQMDLCFHPPALCVCVFFFWLGNTKIPCPFGRKWSATAVTFSPGRLHPTPLDGVGRFGGKWPYLLFLCGGNYENNSIKIKICWKFFEFLKFLKISDFDALELN